MVVAGVDYSWFNEKFEGGDSRRLPVFTEVEVEGNCRRGVQHAAEGGK